MARSSYWANSALADWLRGTPKPGALTSQGWSQWNKQARADHPIRYWIAEEGLNKLQKFVMYPIDKLHDFKYYVNNRWITRTHALTAHPRDIPRGEWRDVGNRFLPCLFNELVDFVEIELAWWHLVWEGKKKRAEYNAPWWRFGWWNTRLWRCQKAGLDNLEWQRNLRWKEEEVGSNDPNVGKLTPQAVSAQEIYDLYMWWTVTRPARPDPHDASGWSAYNDLRQRSMPEGTSFWDMLDSDETEDEREKSQRLMKLANEIENKYEQEDEDMLIRLIKIRHSLWT
jgi:hypothetical protein